jgi:hypothetical protein
VADWKVSCRAAAIGATAGTAIGLLAFLFLTSRQYPQMGGILFLMVPVVAGFSVTLVARRPNSIVAAALLSVVGSLVLLIALGKEGVLCALLALPIIVAGLAIGAGIGFLVRKYVVKRAANQNTTTGILLLIAPMLILAGGRVERPMLRHPRTEVIQTAVEVNDSSERVWLNILSIDSLKASKPMLMYVGLPIPQRCTMQGKGVGAKRTCYFNVGYIEETVTGWNPPYFLGLSIDRTHMPGRHWLGFERAEYRLESKGRTTVVTRTTTITSHLRPSWYWSPLERLGIQSEHRYILQDLVLRAGQLAPV